MVTNIPREIVSQISLLSNEINSAGENIVLLKHVYKLEALDINIEDLIPLPDTSATPKPYLPSPKSIKL